MKTRDESQGRNAVARTGVGCYQRRVMLVHES